LDAAAARQLNDNLLPILLRSNLHVFLCDKHGAKESSHQFFRLLVLESNDVLIAQHWQEWNGDKAGKLGHPCLLNSSPEMLSVFALAGRIGLDASTSYDAFQPL
jgi:hypothetical protein